MSAEVQVRTVTQHAWAAIEHKLRYKSTRDAPRDLKRRLSRLSALFELADEQFSALRVASRELEERYAASVEQGDLDVPIDSSSLATYVADSATVRKALDLMTEAGFLIRVEEESEDDAKRHDRDRRDLVNLLKWAEIDTLQSFEGALTDAESVRPALERLGERFGEADYLSSYPEDALTLLMYALKLPPRKVIREAYSEKAADLIASALELPLDGEEG